MPTFPYSLVRYIILLSKYNVIIPAKGQTVKSLGRIIWDRVRCAGKRYPALVGGDWELQAAD
jgi:hypothetical protein